MPRSPSRLSLLAPSLALLLAAAAGPALAQQSAQQPVPQSTQNQAPPRQLERVEPGSDVPATTIPSRTRTQINETRDGGQVTEVEVNSSGSHYYMKPNNPPGNAVPGSVTGNTIRAPQWKVGEFDLSGKRKAANETGGNAPTAADAPPPPPMPAWQFLPRSHWMTSPSGSSSFPSAKPWRSRASRAASKTAISS
jgi:hypothetical protein